MGKRPRETDPPSLGIGAPKDLRAAELVVGEERFLVISHAITAPPKVPYDSLTDAESDVVRLAMRGLSNDEIAVERKSSTRTVANQLASIYRKLGVTSRVELATLLGGSARRA